jgi:hypothetical protein
MVILCENKIYSNNSDNFMKMICKESYEYDWGQNIYNIILFLTVVVVFVYIYIVCLMLVYVCIAILKRVL